jgi:hypothetical protein
MDAGAAFANALPADLTSTRAMFVAFASGVRASPAPCGELHDIDGGCVARNPVFSLRL